LSLAAGQGHGLMQGGLVIQAQLALQGQGHGEGFSHR
jgi:hypothetical protein